MTEIQYYTRAPNYGPELQQHTPPTISGALINPLRRSTLLPATNLKAEYWSIFSVLKQDDKHQNIIIICFLQVFNDPEFL